MRMVDLIEYKKNNGEFNHIDKETMAIPEIRKAVLDILGEADNEIV